MYDPLEETVAANDITGRNNCAKFLRITAVWQLGDFASRNFFSTDASSFNHENEKESYRARKRMRSLPSRET
jgi:hypothetical protein